jgi:hypothetical protein
LEVDVKPILDGKENVVPPAAVAKGGEEDLGEENQGEKEVGELPRPHKRRQY